MDNKTEKNLSEDNQNIDKKDETKFKLNLGALVLFIISFLAILNPIIDLLTNFSCNYVFGLYINSVLVALWITVEGALKFIPLTLMILIILSYIILGFSAMKDNIWAILIGIIIYSADMTFYIFTLNISGINLHIEILILLIISFIFLLVTKLKKSKNN